MGEIGENVGSPGMAAFAAIAKRTWIKVFRRPVVLVFSLAQPLMWMIFFGFLFHRYPVSGPEGTLAYRDFLLPGIIAMTLLFGASQSGVGLIRDIQTGFLGRMLLTPAPPSALLGGKLFADGVRILLQAALVAFVGMLAGARFHPRLQALAAAMILAALFLLGYASLSCWLALKTRSQETMGVFIQAVNMPIFFTSSALVPDRHMPAWLSTLAVLNPVSAVAEAMRFGLTGIGRAPSPAAFMALAFASILLFSAAARAMRRAQSG